MFFSQLMKANFEESLNLYDDSMVVFMDKDTKSRNIYNGKNTLGFIILSVLAIGFNFLLPIMLNYGMQGKLGKSTVPLSNYNFLPFWLVILLSSVWTIIWFISKRKVYKAIDMTIRMFNVNNYVIWLLIEVNLLLITLFFKVLTIFGILLLIIFVMVIGYFIFNSKKKFLENLLFDIKREDNKTDVFLKKLSKNAVKYGTVLVTILIIWKFLFPNSSEVRTDFIGMIEVIIMWIVVNIVSIFLEIYLFLPYLLYGYYKAKYPEEYRDYEGKSQKEWYGENYFNKHIKGTESEEWEL